MDSYAQQINCEVENELVNNNQDDNDMDLHSEESFNNTDTTTSRVAVNIPLMISPMRK